MSLRIPNIHAVIDAIPAMAWAASADGSEKYLNDETLAFLGVLRAELSRYSWRDVVHPDDAERFIVARKNYRCDSEFSFKSRMLHVSGEYRWVASGVRPMRDADGEIVGWVGALTDIQQSIECSQRPEQAWDQTGTPLSGLTGEQIRAGRALCRIEQAQLARCAGVSLETIKRLEGFRGPVEATTRTIAALIRAFEAAGVVFDLRSGAGPGVRFAGLQPARNNPRWEKL